MFKLSMILIVTLNSWCLLAPGVMGQEHATDGQLQTQIEQQLDRNLRVANARLRESIEVQVKSGVVTLKGELPTYADRNHVQRLCERVDGVVKIDNRIVIKPLTVSDQKIKSAVHSRLEAHSSIRSSGIQVEVTAGVVRLSGEVDAWSDRRTAAWLARQVQGVADVRNELGVAHGREGPAIPRSDLTISRELESVLAKPGLLANMGVTFDISDGRVRLHGVVRQFAHKQVLAAIVRSIPGVVDVEMQEVLVSRSLNRDAADAEANTWSQNLETLQLAMDAALPQDQNQIEVRADAKTIVLTGTVSSLARKMQLTRLANAFSHEQSIVNDTKVVSKPRKDEAILGDIKNIVSHDSRNFGAEIHIEVSDGHAVLTGKVADFNSKIRLTRIVSGIAGLQKVTNNTTVAWSRNLADDGLKKSIEKRLRENGISGIVVTVQEGNATLSGAMGPESLARAKETAEKTDGIRSVTVRTEQ